jgi:hypothetical protein
MLCQILLYQFQGSGLTFKLCHLCFKLCYSALEFFRFIRIDISSLVYLKTCQISRPGCIHQIFNPLGSITPSLKPSDCLWPERRVEPLLTLVAEQWSQFEIFQRALVKDSFFTVPVFNLLLHGFYPLMRVFRLKSVSLIFYKHARLDLRGLVIALYMRTNAYSVRGFVIPAFKLWAGCTVAVAALRGCLLWLRCCLPLVSFPVNMLPAPGIFPCEHAVRPLKGAQKNQK